MPNGLLNLETLDKWRAKQCGTVFSGFISYEEAEIKTSPASPDARLVMLESQIDGLAAAVRVLTERVQALERDCV